MSQSQEVGRRKNYQRVKDKSEKSESEEEEEVVEIIPNLSIGVMM